MAAAAAIGRAAGYTSAGTIEFLVDAAGEFYFLEMNTRLQVEHPITEAVTGVDFVRAQIEIAQRREVTEMADLKLGTRKRRVPADSGMATRSKCVSMRRTLTKGFSRRPARSRTLRAPAGPGIRDDSGAFEGWTVPTAYDPLVSKVIAWAPDRPGAIARMVRALTEYDIRGISTTIGFCRDLDRARRLLPRRFDTTSVDRLLEENGRARRKVDETEELAAIAAAIGRRTRPADGNGRYRSGTGRASRSAGTRLDPTRYVALGATRAAGEPAVNFDVARERAAVEGRDRAGGGRRARSPSTSRARAGVVDASWIDADTLSLIDGGRRRARCASASRGTAARSACRFGGRMFERRRLVGRETSQPTRRGSRPSRARTRVRVGATP